MRLVPASEQQKRARDPVAWAEWGSRLSVEQFLEREQRLRAHAWCREGMQTWLWCGSGDEVLASCESFRMRSFIGLGSPGDREEGVTFGVASVLTEQRLRGHGYASGMMRALVERLRVEPGAHGSLLYSDVGATLYERAGYVPRPAPDRVFSPLPGEPSRSVDALIAENGLATALEQVPVPEDPFVVWPTATQLDWHLERARVYESLLNEPRPVACGARAGSSTAFWAADLKNRVLRILLLAAFSEAEGVALMRAARQEAHATGLSEVRLCEQPVPFHWPASEDGGALSERIGELPMLVAFDSRVRPEQWNLAPRALWV